ncbi:MAG TPA: branched-chain amino acid ABC transporter permease [Vicinamibacterales bacterium]|nr:branched-chain amino acid ABC transporter permease [Vicinamibacterales bacterium]
MELLAQQILNGLVTGSVYSLVALGLTLIYGTMQVPNFAHGQLFMFGAYLSYALVMRSGLHYWLAMAIAVATLAVAGAVLERVIFRPLRSAPPLNSMIAALGVMLLLEAVAQNIWGPEFRHTNTPYAEIVSVFGLPVAQHRLILLAAAAASMTALLLFLTRTTAGSAIRATAQNPEGALLVGIDTSRVAMATFAISAALAAVAGALIAPISLVYPAMGTVVTLKAFAIVVLGGMGSVTGALIGGYLLALAESLGGTYVSATYQDLIAFVVLALVFTFRPEGLFKASV